MAKKEVGSPQSIIVEKEGVVSDILNPETTSETLPAKDEWWVLGEVALLGMPVRVITNNAGEWRYIGRDACTALNYTNHRMTLKRIDPQYVSMIYILGGDGKKYRTKVLTIEGYLELITWCEIPETRPLRKLAMALLTQYHNTGKVEVDLLPEELRTVLPSNEITKLLTPVVFDDGDDEPEDDDPIDDKDEGNGVTIGDPPAVAPPAKPEKVKVADTRSPAQKTTDKRTRQGTAAAKRVKKAAAEKTKRDTQLNEDAKKDAALGDTTVPPTPPVADRGLTPAKIPLDFGLTQVVKYIRDCVTAINAPDIDVMEGEAQALTDMFLGKRYSIIPHTFVVQYEDYDDDRWKTAITEAIDNYALPEVIETIVDYCDFDVVKAALRQLESTPASGEER